MLIGLSVVAFGLLIIIFAAGHGISLARQGDISMIPLIYIAGFLFLIGLGFIIFNLL
ncbi:hypothetical protein [Fructobacillus ficulneus]|uniref:Uncharacterized protein n=1 Tax=Fructobacillus ficulneus TaxID=157463 RepID=A0A0K8MFN8_9LACO|nr:hypothetical protein [Fructobacillus ficulneus]GAO99325.1 hypothetical protein FFIC_091530 [Fructobacillus ficulneus]